MRTFKRLAFLLLLIALFVELLILFPHQIKRDPPMELSSGGEKNSAAANNEQYMRDVHLVESQQGARDWELFSDKAKGNKTSGQWDLDVVRVLFYARNDLQFTVSSQRGGLESENKDIRFSGKVEVKSPKGFVFKTEAVRYDSKERELLSEDPVKLMGPSDQSGAGLQVGGKRMTLDVDTSEMLLDGGVAAIKQIKKDKNVKVKASKSLISQTANEVSFIGNSVFDYDDMQIESPSAKMLFGPRSELVKVMFEGGVTLTGHNRKATSESLTFDFTANQLRFTGKPRLVQGNDELHGDEIIFLDGGRKVKVEKIKANVKKSE